MTRKEFFYFLCVGVGVRGILIFNVKLCTPKERWRVEEERCVIDGRRALKILGNERKW